MMSSVSKKYRMGCFIIVNTIKITIRENVMILHEEKKSKINFFKCMCELKLLYHVELLPSLLR